MWRVKIMCPNMYTKWPNGCGLRTSDSAWSNPKVLLVSNVKRNRVRWNLKFYYQNQDQNSFYSLWNLFNVSLSVQREANKLCIFLDYWFFISFLINLFIVMQVPPRCVDWCGVSERAISSSRSDSRSVLVVVKVVVVVVLLLLLLSSSRSDSRSPRDQSTMA